MYGTFAPDLMEPRQGWINQSHKDDMSLFSGGSFHSCEYILIGNLALLEKAHNTGIQNNAHSGLCSRASYIALFPPHTLAW